MNDKDIFLQEYTNTLLEAYGILANKDETLDKPVFKKLKRQALYSVLYQLSIHKIRIPTDNPPTDASVHAKNALLSFFIYQNIRSIIFLLVGILLSTLSMALLFSFTDYRDSSIFSIGAGFFFVFYFLKKHFDLCIYERFSKFLLEVSTRKSALKIAEGFLKDTDENNISNK